MNYLDYFHETKRNLESTLNIKLQQDVDFAFSNSNFVSKYKGIFETQDAASRAKQDVARLRTLRAETASFAFLLCEQISVLDIDLSEEAIASNVTFEEVLDELNKKLLDEGASSSDCIDLASSYYITSKRGCHIYFYHTNAQLNQKRTTKLTVRGKLIKIDWLARRSGQAQADFAFFMPPKDKLELEDAEYEKCYYKKPHGDDFSKILKPSNNLVSALIAVLNVDFKVRAMPITENNDSLFDEIPVLSSVQISQSKALEELYQGLISLDIPNQPLLKLGQILERENALFEALSKRLGGDIPLIEHVRALKAGERLNGTSNNCMAFYLNAYLLDGAADLESDKARSDFQKFVDTLFVLLQVSGDNIRHFESTIEKYHISEIYNGKDATARRRAYREYESANSSLISNGGYNKENSSFVNKDLATFNKFVDKFLSEGAPIPFFDDTEDKFAIFDGISIQHFSLSNFKYMVEKAQGVKLGAKGEMTLADIPKASPIYDPSRSELFFVEDIDDSARLVSTKAHRLCINTYKPSKARTRFFNPSPNLPIHVNSLESFIDALKTYSPYTYHLLNNLTGQDAKGIAVVCSALARHLENPSTHQQAITFQDLGGTGKSTFAEAVSMMFGSDGVNVTSDSIGSKFLRKSFDGQLFTHCEDISAAALTSNEFTSFLKTYVGNPTLRLEDKNSRQVSIKNYNLMIITTNYTGAFATENGNVNRRLTIINAATKSKSLQEVEHWNAIDFDEARSNFFFEFNSEFVDVLSYSLKFLLGKEYKERYLSPIFESLTEDSKSRITPDSIAESISTALFAKPNEVAEIDGEQKNVVELHRMKLALAIQALSPLDGSFRASAFNELIDTLREQRSCVLSSHSLKYAFGKLGSQVFSILENDANKPKVVRYTSCMDIDVREHKVARKSTYKALALWNVKSGEPLPNGIAKRLSFDESEVG